MGEDITGWADRIEHAIGRIERCAVAQVYVYQRVSSTQDAAFRHRFDGRGVLAIASEQTAGRGRLGRRWDDGVAATLPLSIAIRTGLDDVGLAARAGLAALDACADRLPGVDVLIKWPNDIIVRSDSADQKLAGVLIERRDGHAIVGIGINIRSIVTEKRYDPVSFDQLGVRADRCDLAIGVIERFSAWLHSDDLAVRARWASSDAMIGTARAFESDRTPVRGTVTSLDPLRSIVIRTGEGDREIAVASARNLD
ncbi:MAG: biotin--[acetyl-CoA-carboxylase] ligase [Planctomycetota bacterium]